jgi:voltage-gated potassium channel
VLFPHRDRPLWALLRRLAVAVGLLLFVAGATWLGRGGYQDADGNGVTALDAIYYSTVTMTTTGYGDITPITPTARAVTAFVVTPARILFLIVLVGTTLELLTEQFRQSVAESRWRKRVSGHIVVVGYGTKGRGAVESIAASGEATRDQIVVIDLDDATLADARAAGSVAIVGNGTRIAVLQLARIEAADALIVTPDRDDTATLVTLTARELNPRIRIAAAVHEAENAHLLRQSGADTVIVTAEAAGRLLGLSTQQPRAVAVFEDLLVAGEGLDLVERPAAASEIAGPPAVMDGKLPIAVVRDGQRIPFDAEGFQHVEPGDVVVCVGT